MRIGSSRYPLTTYLDWRWMVNMMKIKGWANTIIRVRLRQLEPLSKYICFSLLDKNISIVSECIIQLNSQLLCVTFHSQLST